MRKRLYHAAAATFSAIAAAFCLRAAGAQPGHWSFKPPVRPAVPAVKNRAWVRNPIDAFVLRRLEQRGLSPSPPADRRTLLRRITLDLTGLLPTPDETAVFVSDRGANAWERVVKRLLDSPRYGERWAQHWLDVVRWAESNGYEHDGDRPQARRYRDWVVSALNADMPYDKFIRLQVAGDLIAPHDFDARVATGFLRAGPQHITGGNQDEKLNRQEWLTEAVNGIGNALLGVTIGCARCHDHKYDPISQSEYYQLQAYLAPTANQDYTPAPDAEKKAFDATVKSINERKKPIEQLIAAIEKPYRERLRQEKLDKLPPDVRAAFHTEAAKRTPAQKKLVSENGALLNVSWDEVVNALSQADRDRRAGLRRELFALDDQMPEPLETAAGVGDRTGSPSPMHLLVRGDPHMDGEEVKPGVPAALANPSLRAYSSRAVTASFDRQGGGSGPQNRLALADWLASPSNPLTARVAVNRLWHYHFGRGIVSTPNDFGFNGQRPTHPELLDWLAAELSRSNGSLKRIHYLICTSNAFRQSSGYDARKAAADPENLLIWRMNRRRLDAESLRDSVLQMNGRLNLAAGGPSIHVPLEPEVYDTIFTEYEADNLWPVTKNPGEHTRRSIYLFRKRNVRLPMLALFDQPDYMSSCAARGQSVHALQALTLVNGPFMVNESRFLASRILRESPLTDVRITHLFELALCREPAPAERVAAARFIASQSALIRARLKRGEKIARIPALPGNTDPAEAAAWADICLATCNLNEFAYVK